MCNPSCIVAVIPAYNEARTIRDLVLRTARFVGAVVVVDDGSTDGTASALNGTGATVLVNRANLGKGTSLQIGLAEALELGASAVITLDGDGQHRPEDIPRLVQAAQRSAHRIIVAARTENRSAAPTLRRFANLFADFWVSWAAGYPVKDSQSGFRLYPSGLLRKLGVPNAPGRGFVFESQVLIEAARLSVFSEPVPIQTLYAHNGRRSHYRPVRDTLGITRMVASKLLRSGMNLAGLLRALGVLPDPRRKAETNLRHL